MVTIELDPWQHQVLEVPKERNIAVRAGRQVGKSTIISILAAEHVTHNDNQFVMIIAASDRQSQLLFEKILNYTIDNYKHLICAGNNRPTLHRILLKNGSTVMCLPCGLDGSTIRGYSVDWLIIDECAYVPEAVFNAVTPMLAVRKGRIIALSTPAGSDGYFYRCFSDPTFDTFHVSSEDCPRKNQEFLDQERKRMTALQYAQEYLGEFISELRRWFSDEWITNALTLQREFSVDAKSTSLFPISGDLYCGCDVGHRGEDQTVIMSMARIDREKLKQVDMQILMKSSIPDTFRAIKAADSRYHYKAIYVDVAGVGAGCVDMLLEDDQTKRKTIAIDNAKMSLDNKDEVKKKLMKEDLYTNLLRLGEQGKVHFFNEPDISASFRSVQYEYTQDKNGKSRLVIFGNFTHIVESAIRAAWCMKDKSLNIWCR